MKELKMRPKIYLFGDSITEESFSIGGWGAILANHFCRAVDIVLRGYSGYNTRWALHVLEKIFPEETINGDPLAVTLFFGANDASLQGRYCEFQHVPVDEFKSNLKAISSFFKKKWPNTTVIFITPPPVDEDGRLLFPFSENPLGLVERTNEAAGEYAKACISVAEECGAPVIDLWTKMQQVPGWQNSYLRDGLHLTEAGNKVVFEELIEKLSQVGVSLETQQIDLPLITEIDHHNPLKSFHN
ncbi:GDSL esterase/lipase At5g45920-like [Impatiens glandulifera]|uniref:GDSL esterase/lipase At5g45920-like n=1 Tax=Impatiens glandulifera TaxID=253017 RepID=UPI001FB0D595|nr:GDSL esterase/lipase At5g45920-like [Impatiens glandulifera]